MTHKTVEVAVAVIVNHKQEVLISLRADDVHQGGLWEFPGGKIEPGESVQQALSRELLEELSIAPTQITLFKKIDHQYIDKLVRLHVCLVSAFDGQPVGVEGQEVKWHTIDSLDPDEFPAANRSIIHALKLPDKYMITGAFTDENDFLEKLENSLQQSIALVQMRCKQLDQARFMLLAKAAANLCRQYQAQLLLNTSPSCFRSIEQQGVTVAGLHLTGQQLYEQDKRPVKSNYLLSASCHSLQDIVQAKKIAADILLLSPIKHTASHPDAVAVGWAFFQQAVESIETPVYALGGLDERDIEQAIKLGGQGIAGISCFWGRD